MISDIVNLLRQQVAAAVRRAAGPAAFAVVAALFTLFAIAGLFAALFFWVEPEHGPLAASLICTAVALVLAALAAIPLVLGPRKPPPQPVEPLLPQFVTLMSKSTSSLAPKQLIVTAAVAGVVLLLSARGGARR